MDGSQEPSPRLINWVINNIYYWAVFFHATNLFFITLVSSKALLIHQLNNYVFLFSNSWACSSGKAFYHNLCSSSSNLWSDPSFNPFIRASKIIISEILLHSHINKIKNSSLFLFWSHFLYFLSCMVLFIHHFLTLINMHISIICTTVQTTKESF